MEMSEWFYQDAYRREFDAAVVECAESGQKRGTFEVVLENTCFYPEGGGQPADRGTLESAEDGAVQVLDVQRRADDRVVHYTDRALPVGRMVHGRIDWTRRFDLMQNHSGEHIISGLVHQHYGYENVGYHMGEVITIDLSGPLTWEELMEIEREANGVVYDNRPIEITYPAPEELERIPYRSKKELTGTVRIVTVPGADICACCGTHVARTGEIGVIKCLSMMRYKGGVRIEMASGGRALRILERRMDSLMALSREMAVSPEEAESAFAKIRADSLAKSQKIAERTQMYYSVRAAAMPEGAPLAAAFEESLDPVETRRFCEFLLEQNRGTVCLAVSGGEDNWYYVIGSRSVDVRPGGRELNQRLNGRGGGKPEMVQGTFHAAREEILSAAEEIFG